MISIGDRRISDVRIGNSPVDAVYYGGDYVWFRERFVAVGSSVAVRSFDGINWTTGISPIGMSGIAYGNGRFVAVGGHTTAVSTDGITWNATQMSLSINLHAVSFGSGMFVAVGANGVVFVSEDGLAWEMKSSRTGFDLNGIGYGDGLFRAVGEEGAFVESRDGENWIDGSLGDFSWYGVAIANEAVVMVGSHGAVTYNEYYSQQGGDSAWNSVTFGNGKFVGVGDGGKFFYSTNSTWVTRTKESAVSWHGIAYGNGKFVAVGLGGWIMFSENGKDWTSFQVGNSNFTAICHT